MNPSRFTSIASASAARDGAGELVLLDQAARLTIRLIETVASASPAPTFSRRQRLLRILARLEAAVQKAANKKEAL